MRPYSCSGFTAHHSSRRSSTLVCPSSRPARRHAMWLQASRVAGRPLQPRSRPQQQQGPQQQQQEQQQSQSTAAADESTNSASSIRQMQQQAQSAMSYSPLLLVSVLWGSYAPTLRYLYSMDPDLTPQVLTAHRTVISAVTLLAASAASLGYKAYMQRRQREQEAQAALLLQQQLEQQQAQQHWWRLSSWLPEWAQHFGRSSNSREQQQEEDSSSSSTGDSAAATASAAAVLAAGLELGIWNFLGTSSQAIGLELSTATKAAFLTQTTALFTPCLAVLCGQAVLPVHWLACIAALLGSCCITLDSLLDTQQQQQQQAAVEVAAAAAPSAATAVSSGSSSITMVLVAPALVDVPQAADAAVLAAADGSSSSSVFDVGSSNGDTAAAAVIQQEQPVAFVDSIEPVAAAELGESSSVSSSAGAVVPAVTCNPTATPPQGVVHAIVCGPVPPASSSSSNVSVGDGNSSDVAAAAAAELSSASDKSGAASSSSTSTVSPMLQQQQQLASDTTTSSSSSATVVDPQSSSSSMINQQQQQQQEQALAAQPADQDSSSSLTSNWGGEVYILLACCCYAIATVRLSMMAPGLDPVQLATSKTLTLAAASLCWLLAFQEGSVTTAAAAAAPAAAAAAGEGLQLKQALAAALQSAADKWQMPDSFSHGSGMLLLVYSALGPGALAAVMQAKGQAVASAAEAQVLYSLTPVMSALLAAACLQGEEMGPLAWLGGAIIVAASLGTAVSGSGDSSRSAAAEDNSSASSSSSSDDDGAAESASSGRRWFGGGGSRGGSNSSSRSSTRSSSPSN